LKTLLSHRNFPWLASGIAGVLFIAIAAYVFSGGRPHELAFNRALQGMRIGLLDSIAICITLSGDTIVLIWIAAAMIGALAYNRQYRLAATVLAASVATPLLVMALKGWVQRPRPTIDLYHGVEAFSFPSGHTTNSAVLYGILMLLAYSPIFGRPRMWLAGMLGALVVLIGLSRIYLAAHWPTDVIAGWCIASIVLALVSVVIRKQAVVQQRERTVLWVAGAGAIFGLAYGAFNFAKAAEKYQPRIAIEVTLHKVSSPDFTPVG